MTRRTLRLRFRFAGALLLACVGVSTATLPTRVEAQADDARAAYQRGQEAYNQGRYEDAIRDFQRAYELDPRPALLYNVAQAYERAGQLREALEALQRYLAAAPTAPNRAEAQLKARNLEDRLNRTGVRIVAQVEGAAISVDNQAWGQTPRPDAIRVAPGSHTIRVTKQGFAPFTTRVIVPAGQVLDVEVEMEVTDGGGGRPRGGEEGAGGEGEGDGEPAAGEEAGVSTSSGGSIVPYLLMGGGGALVAGGAVLGIVALGAAKDAPASEGSDADGARTMALFADIGIGVGVVAAAVGAYLLFTAEDSGDQEPAAGAVGATPVLAPGYAGAAATVRFQ